MSYRRQAAVRVFLPRCRGAATLLTWSGDGRWRFSYLLVERSSQLVGCCKAVEYWGDRADPVALHVAFVAVPHMTWGAL